MKTIAFLTTLALGVSVSAFAQTAATPAAPKDPLATPKIDQRQVQQQQRIDQGVASGALTSKEAENLEKRQEKIATDKAAAQADGKVTRAERRKLHREQNRSGAAIKRQKHDKQKITQ